MFERKIALKLFEIGEGIYDEFDENKVPSVIVKL